jgi:transposase
MVSAPLYLFSNFFEWKAIEHLLGSGIQASQLNPDEMIVKYKEQQAAERGFGFLKDPYFLRIACSLSRRKESRL